MTILFGRIRLVMLVSLVGLLALGCGSDAPRYPTARIEGTVTIKGESVKQGMIHFVPQAATDGQPVTQAEIVDGRYLAPAVPLGKMRVTFNAVKETGKMMGAGEGAYPEIVSIIPKKYEEGLTIEITGDNPKLDFALTPER